LIVLCRFVSRKRTLGRESSLTHLGACFKNTHYQKLNNFTLKNLSVYLLAKTIILAVRNRVFSSCTSPYSCTYKPITTTRVPSQTCICLSSYWTNEEMSADGIQIRPLRHSSLSAVRQFFNSCTWA